MAYMAVHTAVGKQSHEVEPASPGAYSGTQIKNYRIFEQSPVFNGQIYTRHILIYHASGSDIQMPYLRIADKAIRQTYITAGGGKRCHAGQRKQPIQHGSTGKGYGVPRPGRSQAEAVKNKQQYGRDRFHVSPAVFHEAEGTSGKRSASRHRLSR